MYRSELINIYLDWVNNFVSINTYAEHYGYSNSEALQLINLAREVFNNNHPEE